MPRYFCTILGATFGATCATFGAMYLPLVFTFLHNGKAEKKAKPFENSMFSKGLLGRGRRARTLGTRFWRPLLYQLSYTPISPPLLQGHLVDHQGLEPRTDRL